MKKITLILSIIVVLVVVIISTNGYKPTSTNNEPIKIGAVISLTGFAAPWGEYAKNGMDLAVKSINDSGSIKGRKVELVIEDDRTEGKDTVSAYNKLISLDKVDGVIGGVFDFTTQPIIPLALTNQTVLISPSVFRISGSLETNAQSFVMLPDFSKVIRQLDSYIKKENIKNLAVVHFQSSFGKEIAKTLDSVMKENGKSGIIDEEYAKIGDNDFKTTIAKLKTKNVDAVFLDMVGNDPVNFLIQAKQLGFTPKIISYNGLTDSFVDVKDKSLLEGVVILNWEVSNPTFTSLYKSAYGLEPTKSADKYFDAIYVLANAIANSPDRSQVASYISSNSFITPNSTISFNKNHSVDTTPLEIQIIKNGVARKY
jgi:branched-chain amino acid transport system substrate-binding protein